MSTLVSVILLLLLFMAAIILYALRTKGYVSAECSLRSFRFTLHAKDRTTAQLPKGNAPNCGEHSASNCSCRARTQGE